MRSYIGSAFSLRTLKYNIMRRILLLLLFLPLALTSYAQNEAETPVQAIQDLFSNPQKRKSKIAKDKIAADGSRWVWGDYRYSYVGSSTQQKSVRMMVVGTQSESIGTNYMVCFGIHEADIKLTIEKDSPVLIKFGDDSVLQTKNLFYDEDLVGEPHVLTYSTFYTYDIYAYIPVTEELLAGLQKGFKKIRFEVNGDIYDVEPKKDNVSEFILEEYKLIKEAIQTKRSFTDDF